jgi:restriction system protein
MWEIIIKHEGLHAYRTVRGATQQEAETKARLQAEAWDARWARLVERETSRQKKLEKRNWEDKQSDIDKRAKEHALELTKDPEAAMDGLRELLSSALDKPQSFNWESLKDTSRFEKPEPSVPGLEGIPAEPLITESQFVATPVPSTIKFVDWIIPGAREKKLKAVRMEEESRRKNAQQRFAFAHYLCTINIK